MSSVPAWAFRSLDPDEEKTFRQWARDHWVQGKEPSEAWHPVVRNEWYRQEILEQIDETSDQEVKQELIDRLEKLGGVHVQ